MRRRRRGGGAEEREGGRSEKTQKGFSGLAWFKRGLVDQQGGDAMEREELWDWVEGGGSDDERTWLSPYLQCFLERWKIEKLLSTSYC